MKTVIKFEIRNETLAENIIGRLKQWGYDVTLNRQIHESGTGEVKEYVVDD